MTRDQIEERTGQLLMPILRELNFECVDVEYVKEGSNMYLRAYIDKEGGITIDDCEVVSKALEISLDKEDFIKDAYYLEISSPGIGRPLKKDKDYERHLGKELEVKLYAPYQGQKEMYGDLISYTDTEVILSVDGKEVKLERKGIALIREAIHF